jgi:hypothetical protein
MIGSWVMLVYQELYGVRYALRTMDIDFAVHIVHTRSQLRADLKQLITGLGFTDYLAAEGVQKFTGDGYERNWGQIFFLDNCKRRTTQTSTSLSFPAVKDF